MKSNIKRNNSTILKTGLSLILTIIIQFILLLASSVIVSNNDIPNEILPIFWYIIITLSSFIGGFLTAKTQQSKGFLWGAMSGGVSSAFAFIILFLNCSMCINLNIFLLLPIGLIAGTVGGIISSNLK